MPSKEEHCPAGGLHESDHCICTKCGLKTSRFETRKPLLDRLRADGGRYLLSVGLTRKERDAQPEPTYGGKGRHRWLTDEEYAALCSIGSAHETKADPSAVLQWAVDSFGPTALNRDERAARVTEEAIEVAQVEGVPLEVIQRITERVYSRPVGELGQEIGGLMVCLYALAANCGVDFDAEFRREFARVLSKPRDWWQRKHAEKVAAGTADLSPTSSLKASDDRTELESQDDRDLDAWHGDR